MTNTDNKTDNKTDNSGTPLTVDDNTVKRVTTAASDANNAHKEHNDVNTTIAASDNCTIQKDNDCSAHPIVKPPSITTPSIPCKKTTFTTEHTTEPPKVAPASWSRTFVSRSSL